MAEKHQKKKKGSALKILLAVLLLLVLALLVALYLVVFPVRLWVLACR